MAFLGKRRGGRSLIDAWTRRPCLVCLLPVLLASVAAPYLVDRGNWYKGQHEQKKTYGAQSRNGATGTRPLAPLRLAR